MKPRPLAGAPRRQFASEARARIDAEFDAMAHDADHHREALRIAEEFRFADWEALVLGDRS